jgi:trimeric autotransporter adhesin
MNKNLIPGLAIAAILLVGGFALFTMSQPPATVPQPIPTPTPVPVPTPVPTPVPPSPSAPTVNTNSSAVPSSTTVVVTGNVTPNGALTTYWYEYGKTTGLGTRTTTQSVGSGYTSIFAPSYITGLSSNTTYYFRLSAENRFGTVNGATYSFTTNTNPPPQGSAPTTRTIAASNITRTTANLNGQVDPNRAEATYWFEYGETADLGFVTALQSAGSGDASTNVSISVSGLKPLTKYFFRLNAQNQFGTVNGSILNFTTSGPAAPGEPSADTKAATNITSSSVTLNASINPNGAETTYWFEYSEDSLLGSVISTSTSSSTINGTTTENVSTNVTGLDNNTKYFYRVVAQNQNGTVRGDTMSFTTRN